MHKFFEKVEHYNAKLIPYAIVALLIIIIMELFVHTENHTVELILHIADMIVIGIFVIDLIFLAIHARSIQYFFRNYWLDIIAVFPFALMLRSASEVAKIIKAGEFAAILGFGQTVSTSQAILHESVELSKAAAESEKLSKLTRVGKEIKISARILRILTKSKFFSRFKGKKRETKKKFRS